MGAYARWVLIRGWALIKFAPFSASVVCLFCNNTINGNNKTRRCNKERFLQNTLKKTPSPGKSLISTYLMFFRLEGPERGWGRGLGAYLSLRLGGARPGGGGRLFEVGANSRLDAYSNKYGNHSLRKQPAFHDSPIGFPAK